MDVRLKTKARWNAPRHCVSALGVEPTRLLNRSDMKTEVPAYQTACDRIRALLRGQPNTKLDLIERVVSELVRNGRRKSVVRRRRDPEAVSAP